MLADPRKHALLFQYPLQLLAPPVIQDHIRQSVRRVAHMEEIRNLATRACNGHYLTCRRPRRPLFGRVDHIPQLYGESAMPHLGLMGSHLHRNRIELPIVLIDVRFYERFDLVCAGHDANFLRNVAC